jgi:CheY-like chemotaxis protein
MPTKILAIDDSKTMRLAIKITFAAEDAKVTAVSKGSEAVARAKQMQADIVLVDHKLAPGEPSGFEVVQALKANPATAKIPVIMLVPARGGISEAEIMAAGADNYIGKPFDTQELIDKVAAALGRGARPAIAQPTVPAPTVKPVAPVATPPKTPVVATPPKTPVAPVATPPKTPVVAPPKTPVVTPPATRAAPATPKTPTTRPVAPTPAVTPRTPPATTPAAGTKPLPARPVGGPPATGVAATAASAGPANIPIAIPIPFTAASSPTPGMLERLKSAAGTNGAVAGLDPAAVRALLALSQEVVEQIVWEVVPDLAEEIIKQKVST